MLNPGTPAPDFERPAHDGSTVRLSDFRGRKAVVLFFYPKDDTLICTREACAFRDAHRDFVEAGAEVLGVSPDPLSSHKAFAAGQRLPYRLISDEDGSLSAAFGVTRFLGITPGRVTFVVDKGGIVRASFRADLRAGRHVTEALKALKTP